MILNRYLKCAVFMEEQSFLSEHAASLSSWINSPTFLNSGRDKSWLRAWSTVIESGILNIFLQFVFSYWIRNCKRMILLFFVNMIIRILLYINIDINGVWILLPGKMYYVVQIVQTILANICMISTYLLICFLRNVK